MDFAVVNARPGKCEKCNGTGVYRWGPIVNGKCAKEGQCFSCRGTGKQDTRQIRRNAAYNRHKIVHIY